MEKYRHIIGWGAIVVAALNFIPLPLPALPPMLTAEMVLLLPGLGPVLLMLAPMLLFAAGIGLVKGWDGGRKLFVIWAGVGGCRRAGICAGRGGGGSGGDWCFAGGGALG